MTLANVAVRKLPSKRRLCLVVNFTTPAMTEYRVSSVPLRTFLPGCILVPRCRTSIIPDFIVCPSPTLVPKYCGFESRPNLVDPPAFLCAIGVLCITSLLFDSTYENLSGEQPLCDLSMMGTVIVNHIVTLLKQIIHFV